MGFNIHLAFLITFVLTIAFIVLGISSITIWLYHFVTPNSWRFLSNQTLMIIDFLAFIYFIFFCNIAGGLFLQARKKGGGVTSYY